MDALLNSLGIHAQTTFIDGIKFYKFKDLVGGNANARIRNYFNHKEEVLCSSKIQYVLAECNALYITADMGLLVLSKYLDNIDNRFKWANCLFKAIEPFSTSTQNAEPNNSSSNNTQQSSVYSNSMENDNATCILEEGTVPDFCLTIQNSSNSNSSNCLESCNNHSSNMFVTPTISSNMLESNCAQAENKSKRNIDRRQKIASNEKLTRRVINSSTKRTNEELDNEEEVNLVQCTKKVKSDQTVQSEESRRNVEKKVNEALKGMLEKHDQDIVTGVNVGRLNLCADDEGRCARLVHNSTRVGMFENSLSRAKAQCDDFVKTFEEMAHEANLRLAHVLYGYFLKNPIQIGNLIHAIAATKRPENVKEEDFVEIKNLQYQLSQQASLARQLKVKDEEGISHRTWKLYCYTLGINLQPDLSSFTKEVNGMLVEYFGLEQKLNGFIVKLAPVLEALVKAHLHNVNVRKSEELPIPEDIIPSTLKVKLSMDGRTLGRLRTVVVTLQILNLGAYGTQERLSVFPLALYIGEESEVKQYVEHFKNEIIDLSQSGLKIEQSNTDASLGIDSRLQIPINFYWVSDLASLGYISLLRENDGFCFACRCRRHQSRQYLGINHPTGAPPDLQHSMGIATGNIFFCVLHMDESF